ncbi:hypothetical protein D1007_18280 [Hordeum vulgare]|nr:hypothetical protein D1007_18280 [Hordeum vulgare]
MTSKPSDELLVASSLPRRLGAAGDEEDACATAPSSPSLRFCACVQQILNRNGSGMSLSDKERDAHHLFIELDEKKKPCKSGYNLKR